MRIKDILFAVALSTAVTTLFTGGVRPASATEPPAPVRWEYKMLVGQALKGEWRVLVATGMGNLLWEEANALGKDGWELTNGDMWSPVNGQTASGSGPAQLRLYFKRRL